MLDLEPATRELGRIVHGVRDHQLGAPTPCSELTVGELLDHVDGLSLAFTAAALKEQVDGAGPGPSAPGEDWRSRITGRLATLARAWNGDDAWTGTTEAGGVTMPADVAGVVALDEVVVHGWDIAAATGQTFTCEPHLLAATYRFVRSAVAANPTGSPGLFGPPVPVAEEAPLLDRLIGLTGRDPSWRPVTVS